MSSTPFLGSGFRRSDDGSAAGAFRVTDGPPGQLTFDLMVLARVAAARPEGPTIITYANTGGRLTGSEAHQRHFQSGPAKFAVLQKSPLIASIDDYLAVRRR